MKVFEILATSLLGGSFCSGFNSPRSFLPKIPSFDQRHVRHFAKGVKVESDLDNKDWRVGMCGGNGDIDMLLGSKRPKPDWMVWIGSSSATSHDAVPGISDFYSRDAIKDRFNNAYSTRKASILITKAGGRDDVHNQKSLVGELLHLLRLLYADQKNVVFINGNGAVGVSFVLAECYAM